MLVFSNKYDRVNDIATGLRGLHLEYLLLLLRHTTV